MQGMKIEVLKKGGRPPMDDDSMLEEAIREVARRIDAYDTDSLMGAYREKMKPGEAMEEAGEGESPAAVSKEECPDCAKGECTNPEHMDEDTLRQMLASMGDKGEE